MAKQTIKQTRKNNPRIVEIEAEIDRLTSELVDLVGVTDADRLDTWEDVREAGWEGLDDLTVVRETLSTREIEEEEEGQ